MTERDWDVANADSLGLDHIRSFLALVESGSQVNAAKRRRIAQATVSRHVQRVQEHFGGGLFESSAELRLSARGQLVLRTLESVAAQLSDCRRRTALRRPMLRIGFIRIMRPMVERALRGASGAGDAGFDVRLVELRTEHHPRKLLSGELDLAVCYAFDDLFEVPISIHETRVTDEPFALVVPERAYRRNKLQRRALSGLDYAHLPRRFSRQVSEAAQRWLDDNQIWPASRIECELGTEVISYAASGRGFGFLPALWSTAGHGIDLPKQSSQARPSRANRPDAHCIR